MTIFCVNLSFSIFDPMMGSNNPAFLRVYSRPHLLQPFCSHLNIPPGLISGWFCVSQNREWLSHVQLPCEKQMSFSNIFPPVTEKLPTEARQRVQGQKDPRDSPYFITEMDWNIKVTCLFYCRWVTFIEIRSIADRGQGLVVITDGRLLQNYYFSIDQNYLCITTKSSIFFVSCSS